MEGTELFDRYIVQADMQPGFDRITQIENAPHQVAAARLHGGLKLRKRTGPVLNLERLPPRPARLTLVRLRGVRRFEPALLATRNRIRASQRVGFA